MTADLSIGIVMQWKFFEFEKKSVPRSQRFAFLLRISQVSRLLVGLVSGMTSSHRNLALKNIPTDLNANMDLINETVCQTRNSYKVKYVCACM